MLERYETPEHFVVIQRIRSRIDTKTTVVKYTKDLKQSQIDNDPWRDVHPEDVVWFEKFHRAKCEADKRST